MQIVYIIAAYASCFGICMAGLVAESMPLTILFTVTMFLFLCLANAAGSGWAGTSSFTSTRTSHTEGSYNTNTSTVTNHYHLPQQQQGQAADGISRKEFAEVLAAHMRTVEAITQQQAVSRSLDTCQVAELLAAQTRAIEAITQQAASRSPDTFRTAIPTEFKEIGAINKGALRSVEAERSLIAKPQRRSVLALLQLGQPHSSHRRRG